MKRFTDKPHCTYDLNNVPLNTVCINPTEEEIQRHAAARANGECCLWGWGPHIPEIGAKVRITFNQLGTGTVESYFVEYGWLGVCVLLDKVPEWKRRQQADDLNKCAVALVFGREIELVDSVFSSEVKQ
jgi:hypothetical protein